jgi:hypothetical protein
MEVVDLERREARLNGYVPMMFGGDSKVHGKDHFHLLRRTWLVIGLQIWQELTGIGVGTSASILSAERRSYRFRTYRIQTGRLQRLQGRSSFRHVRYSTAT